MPESIRRILESTMKRLEIDHQVKAYSVWGAWKEIVGESLATQCRPRSIRNRILFVDVSHPGWMQELQFIKPRLLEGLNEFMGEPFFRDIRFNLGKIAGIPAPSPERDSKADERLDTDTLRKIEKMLAGVKAGDLRKALRGMLEKAAKAEKLRTETRSTAIQIAGEREK